MSSIMFSLICKCIIKQTVMQYLFSVYLCHEDKIASVKYVYVNTNISYFKSKRNGSYLLCMHVLCLFNKLKSSIKRP